MDYKNLKDAITAIINENGAQEITGQIMQDTLLSIVSKLGSNKTFAGVARPTTVPDTTDANIFYIAGENGTYVNFGGAKVENEAAVFVQVSGGTWRAIYTGIQTSHGVNNQLQQEHEYFETEINNVSADLTQFKQTEFTDVKEDVAGHATEIAKINGEIATLNESTNTAADELVRIEGKIDANLKDAVVVFVPSTNTGVYKGADILSFTNDTPTSTVTAYMSQYWDQLVKLASGKISGSVYAESNNANCTGGSCIGGTQFGYLKIEIEDYQKGGLGGEVLVLSFESGTEKKEMQFFNKGTYIGIEVNEFPNLVRVSSDMYSAYNIKECASIANENMKIESDSFFKSYIICTDNIEEIVLKYYIHGTARCALIDVNFNIIRLLTFEHLVQTTEILNIKADENKNVKYILYCTRKTDIDKSAIYITKSKMSLCSNIGKINTALFDLSNTNYIDGFRYEPNLEKKTDENTNAIYFYTEYISAILVSCAKDEGEVLCYFVRKDGSYQTVSARLNKDAGTFSLFKLEDNVKLVIINNKKITNKYPNVYAFPKDNIYNIVSNIKYDIDKKASSLFLYGDEINKSNQADLLAQNDEYAPSNEVQTLEEKPMYKNYAYYIAKRNKLKWYDFAFEKATLTDCKTKAAPDLNCVLTDDAIISMTDQKPDYITLWYGVNDAQFNPIMQRELWLKDKYKAEIAYPMQESEIGKDGYATAEQKAEVDKAVGRVGEVDYDNADSYFFAKFVGTENDEELTTWCGALNYAFPLLMSEYPEAKILIICPDHEKHGKLIREATIKMAEKWGVLYFDLNSLPYWYGSEKTKFENTQNEEMQWLLASGETSAPTVEGFNKSRYSYDGVRPSELGHKVISFPIGNKLING